MEAMNKLGEAPDGWLDILAEGDADVEAGRVLPASVVHQDLKESIARLEAKAKALPG